ncbi:MAG: serine hydrolase [Deltaproteobacteria bacterium]|nr:serine hydrolase [Deltaproteobacteria bacterium]
MLAWTSLVSLRLLAQSACALALLSAPLAHAAERPRMHAFPEWPVRLQSEVLRASKTFTGELHVFVKDIPTGVQYSYNSSTPTYLASCVKIAFMVELFRQVRVGKINLSDQIEYSEEDVRDGSPVFGYLAPGTKVPVQVALEAMIHHSDNAASDLVVRTVGIDNVNRTLKELGYRFGPITSLIDVRRLVYGRLDPRVETLSAKEIRSIGFAKGGEERALKLSETLGELPGTFTIPDVHRAFVEYYGTGYNSAAMDETARLIEDIVLGRVVSTQASREMVQIMLGTRTGERRIRAGLPDGTPLAHKTGTQYGRICDMGAMYLDENHPVIFSACTKWGRRESSEDLIARVAKKAFDLIQMETQPGFRQATTSSTAVGADDFDLAFGTESSSQDGALTAAEELLEENWQRKKPDKASDRSKGKKKKKKKKDGDGKNE